MPRRLQIFRRRRQWIRAGVRITTDPTSEDVLRERLFNSTLRFAGAPVESWQDRKPYHYAGKTGSDYNCDYSCNEISH